MSRHSAAFPFLLPTMRPADAERGLTKRELVAAMALQGLLAADTAPNVEACAETAVKAADALLDALKDAK